jgi:hypothetical protein
MTPYHPRIQTALVSINPTKEHPAHHGAPSTQAVLKGVTPAIACWQPYPDANNLREIALHLAIHENAVANRLSGQTILANVKQRKFGWAERLDSLTEEQWKSELALIQSIHARLVEAVAGFDPELLDQIVGKNTTIPAVLFIHGIAEHSLYHTAQMEMLKTLAKQNGL